MQTTISGSPLANLARVMEHQRANMDDSFAALRSRFAPADEPAVQTSFHRRVEQNSEAARLNVRTHDGDKISIELKSREVHTSSLRTRGDHTSIRETSRFSERFEVRFEGHIDEDERAAIETIMGAAFDAAESFFGGGDEVDLDALLAAGAAASNEIASFSLKVRQQSTVVEHYGSRDAGHLVEQRLQTSDAFRVRFETFAQNAQRLQRDAAAILEPADAASLVQRSLAESLDVIAAGRKTFAEHTGAMPGFSLRA